MNDIVNISYSFQVLKMTQSLFGAFAKHSMESCPQQLESKRIFLEIRDKLEKNELKYGVKHIESFICQY
jgi:hypothetical protein